MKGRILKRIRNFRLFSALIIASLTILSFQNCAPANPDSTCAEGDSSCAKEEQTSLSSSSAQNSIWDKRPGGSGGSVSAGGKGASGGSSSSSSGGGASSVSASSGGAISVGSGAVNTGSGRPNTGSSSGNTNNNTFRIVEQPQSIGVNEGARFDLHVDVAGGKSPYTFHWYLNGKLIEGGQNEYSTLSDYADTYRKEGTYYVEIKDAGGATLKSSLARVAIQEPAVGCDGGSYFTYTNGTYDSGYQFFTEYFDGPRGKFLLHQSYDSYNILYRFRDITKLYDYNIPRTLAYMEKITINCRTDIPRIHTKQPNPNWEDYYGNRYNDGNGYRYQGAITFECHNKKLKLLSNSCAWVRQ
ncbi:hypothetical protein [Bdellovibrio reynosensis]|uniref:PKD domain-containing protein n=1 Tax=Bdellovibrio reynosensis TaxID=2835041 RepID=A0ABY4C4T5_9BACT|nr:hypothetical protein [Bdellovibrio reynosensis]UOE99977.1 hypothetical protein MNR06_09725 [Bdellovibrio reynosensis]